jgi:hypothetical protein
VRRTHGLVRLARSRRFLTSAHARLLLALTSSDRRALDELAELEPPPADQARIGSLVTELRAGLAYGERIARASRTRDELGLRAAVAAAVRRLGEGQLTAADYGLAHCARLGLVSRGG